MQANDYQQLARKTLVTENLKDTLTMCALGIAGEAGEVCDAVKKGLFHKGKPIDGGKIADESGDLLWYVAIAAYSLKIEMEELIPVLKFGTGSNFALIGLHLAKDAGNFANLIADQIQVNTYESTDAVEATLRRIVTGVAILAPLIGISLDTIMERNIAKLQARHSSGATTANGGVFNPHYQSDSVKTS